MQEEDNKIFTDYEFWILHLSGNGNYEMVEKQLREIFERSTPRCRFVNLYVFVTYTYTYTYTQIYIYI